MFLICSPSKQSGCTIWRRVNERKFVMFNVNGSRCRSVKTSDHFFQPVFGLKGFHPTFTICYVTFFPPTFSFRKFILRQLLPSHYSARHNSTSSNDPHMLQLSGTQMKHVQTWQVMAEANYLSVVVKWANLISTCAHFSLMSPPVGNASLQQLLPKLIQSRAKKKKSPPSIVLEQLFI